MNIMIGCNSSPSAVECSDKSISHYPDLSNKNIAHS
jgi:hypothetical protein